MIDQIQGLIRFLSKDSLTFADVVARVGPVVTDPGIPQPAELKPSSLTGVRAARLGRYPDDGLPYLLTLQLADGARPTAAALKAVLGDYQRARTDRGHAPQVMFYPPPADGSRWRVVVIAELGPGSASGAGSESLDDAPVTSLSLRRDPP